jgi:hypothetical protein
MAEVNEKSKEGEARRSLDQGYVDGCCISHWKLNSFRSNSRSGESGEASHAPLSNREKKRHERASKAQARLANPRKDFGISHRNL